MDIVQQLQLLKEDLIGLIDDKIEQTIRELQNASELLVENAEDTEPKQYESIYSISMGAGIFKGKRPTGVIFPNGNRIETPTWKRVMEVVLTDCCNDPIKRQALMNLRGRILGRNRVLLGSEVGHMRSPVKIADDLYVETHYDAETLIRILTTRILKPVGYNYNNIKIAIQLE